MVFGYTACRRRTFPEDRGGVLGYLDELGCNNGVEPDKVGKHLFGLCILHADEVIRGNILRVREAGERNPYGIKNGAGENVVFHGYHSGPPAIENTCSVETGMNNEFTPEG